MRVPAEPSVTGTRRSTLPIGIRDSCSGFISSFSSGTCSVKLARKKDSFEVFSSSRRTRYAMPGNSWPYGV